ncbi:macrolide ABC transporter ATP-binding protein [bacterium J17]|nr:macrolide ABC transporter ATP-binding protein [bacterium J17]
MIELQSVSKIYRQGEIEVHALSDVSLSIAEGEFVSLWGPSGSGKTTLLNLIGGLDSPTEGKVFVDGEEVSKLDSSKRASMRLTKVGFVFQAYNLIPVLSARENVEFVMQLQGVDKTLRQEKSMQVLSEVGLEGMEERRPAELSGGQQQRVAVARAIVSEPSLVLADEPTANLDSATAESLLQLMLSLNQKRNIVFIFSTHDQLVMSYARRLVGLKDGKIVSDEIKES